MISLVPTKSGITGVNSISFGSHTDVHIDLEWLSLMNEARSLGLTTEEVRRILQLLINKNE